MFSLRGFFGFLKFAKIRKYFFVKLNFLKKIEKKIRENFFEKTRQPKFLLRKVEQKFCSREFAKIRK